MHTVEGAEYKMADRGELIRNHLQSRLSRLRKLSFGELSALRKKVTDYDKTSGQLVRFTILRVTNADGKLQIVVRCDTKIIGVLWKGESEGFSMAPDGSIENVYNSKGIEFS